MEDQTKEKLNDRMEAAEPGFKAQLEADYRQRSIDVQKQFEKGGFSMSLRSGSERVNLNPILRTHLPVAQAGNAMGYEIPATTKQL